MFALLLMTLNVNAQKEEPVVTCDVMPDYPGGTIAMMGFLQENIKYPAEAKAKKIHGHVIVRFVIEKDGSISDIEKKLS